MPNTHDAQYSEANRLRETVKAPDAWRTPDDVLPLMRAAELLVAAGDVAAAVALVQPTIYNPHDKTSPINKLAAWGAWREIAHTLEKIVPYAADLPRAADQLAVRMVLGTAYERIYDFTNAMPHLERALAQARDLDDQNAVCFILSRYGNIYGYSGDHTAALQVETEALTLARRIGNPFVEGLMLNNIAVGYEILGKLRDALTYYEQAWRVAQRNKDTRAENWYITNITGALLDSGDATGALTFVDRVMPQALRAGNSDALCHLHNTRADAFLALGQDDAAEDYFTRVVALSVKIGSIEEVIRAYVGLGTIALRRTNLSRVHAFLRRAESECALAMDGGSYVADVVVRVLDLQARLRMAEGKIERAAAYFGRMRVVAAESQNAPYQGLAEIGLASVACAGDNPAAALGHLLHAYALLVESEHHVRGQVMHALQAFAATWPEFADRLARETTRVPEINVRVQAELEQNM